MEITAKTILLLQPWLFLREENHTVLSRSKKMTCKIFHWYFKLLSSFSLPPGAGLNSSTQQSLHLSNSITTHSPGHFLSVFDMMGRPVLFMPHCSLTIMLPDMPPALLSTPGKPSDFYQVLPFPTNFSQTLRSVEISLLLESDLRPRILQYALLWPNGYLFPYSWSIQWEKIKSWCLMNM